MDEGAAAGVTGTPAFFINGIFLSGAQPLENFTEVIDQELRRLGIPTGPTAAGEAAAPTS
jgi:predicted DsbA family dithiol-disulfide isomerase